MGVVPRLVELEPHKVKIFKDLEGKVLGSIFGPQNILLYQAELVVIVT